jgi:hypothetical protein
MAGDHRQRLAAAGVVQMEGMGLAHLKDDRYLE